MSAPGFRNLQEKAPSHSHPASSNIQHPRRPTRAMDFSMCNSNGKAPANDGFGSSVKPKPLTPPEPVNLLVNKNQIVVAIIPHNTAKSAPIRQWMHSNVIHPNDRTRLFIFRSSTNNSWTTIALDSTSEAPKLTAEPLTVVTIARAEFNRCPHVSAVTCRDWNGNEITEADIPNLDFDPLTPVPSQAEVPSEPVITANDINAQIAALRTDNDDKWLANNRAIVQLEARLVVRFDQLDARTVQLQGAFTSALDDRLNGIRQLLSAITDAPSIPASTADSAGSSSGTSATAVSGHATAASSSSPLNAGAKPADTPATRKTKGKRRIPNDADADN